ncbi:hypothetical protein GPALN_004185 [Globodera pallida]|nr:hypothetical protein GPALN_004185 [Globodera pallida]
MPVTASTSSVMTALKKAVIGVIGVNVNVMTSSPAPNHPHRCTRTARLRAGSGSPGWAAFGMSRLAAFPFFQLPRLRRVRKLPRDFCLLNVLPVGC